jgi:hypothetical protein
MPGFTPPMAPSQGAEPAQFPLHWVSPQAAAQFVVLIILIVLVLVFWVSCQKEAEDGG